MSKRWLLISLVVFVVLIVASILTVRSAIKNTEFSLKSAGIDANLNNWKDVQTLLSGKGAVTMRFQVEVTNKNWFTIPIRDLESRVYYRGQLIGNSSPAALKNIDVAPGRFKQWIEPVDLHVKGSLVKSFLSDIVQGNDPVISYETELKVLGIRYTYSDQMKIVKTALSELT